MAESSDAQTTQRPHEIVRVSEASVRQDRVEAFIDRLLELVADFPRIHAGLIAHEVLIDELDPTRVIYISYWASVAALIDFAGPSWADQPVTFPDEDSYLVRPLELRHFRRATSLDPR